jgi:tetraprenyl-beta-curcumene synthase
MSHTVAVNPTPLRPALLRALTSAVARELLWGMREVAREIGAWRARAELIRDGPLRDDALHSLERKRTNTEGAALFATLLDGRNRDALRLLVVYQAIWDFLDSLGERHPTEANGRELHQALIDALDPDSPRADYYRHHPWGDDGGYLAALVESCRERCRVLPGYERVRPFVVKEAKRAQVQALNHLFDRQERDTALRRWAETEFEDGEELRWFELTAAASASLVIHPLLALSGKADLTDAEIADTRAAYWPWVSLTTTMLDNYVDQAEDAESGNHNYFTHYADGEQGVRQLCNYIHRSTSGALALPNGNRHAIVVSAMVAMYLSKDGHGSPSARHDLRRLADAGGSLVCLLVPILKVWRIVYSQRSA